MKKIPRMNEFERSPGRFWTALLSGVMFTLFSMNGMAQTLTVSGSAKGASGEPLPGVTVIVKGT